MNRVTLAIIMGLGEKPEGPCLGLRMHVEYLAARFPLDLVFASYKRTDDQIDALLAPYDPQLTILTGHSLGAGQAHTTAMRRIERGLSVAAVGLWEPVPENDAFNGHYRFETIPMVANQIAMRIEGPFPIAWGREFADWTLNVRLKRKEFGIIAVDHAAICQRAEVLKWYNNTVAEVCGRAA